MSTKRIRRTIAYAVCGGAVASIALVGCGSNIPGVTGSMGADDTRNYYVQNINGTKCIVFIGDNSRAAMQCDFSTAAK